MANTITATYSFTLPEVGADTNAWGGHINGNFTTIDNQMLSRTRTAAQTMAGVLNLPANGLNVGSGQLQVTGGNVTASGTFTSTGAITSVSNISGVNGSFSGTLTVTGAAALNNNATVGGTLGVTGAATFSTTVTASFTPSAGGHLTNKTYVDTGDAARLALTGGTMSGNLTISNTAPTINMNDTNVGQFYIQCNDGLIGFLGTAGGWISRTDNSGNFVATGNVTAYSDARLKENVVTIRDAVSLVSRMRGVFFDRIDNGEHGVGVIAQEMQEVLPQVVLDTDGHLSVAYGNLVGVLIEAIKELSDRVEQLEGK